MRAYLEFKGYWLITIEGLPDIANRTTPFAFNPRVAGSTNPPSETWERSIKQRLSNAIIEEIKDLMSTKEIWKHLDDKYNKAGSAQVFGDIQKVYTFQIKGNQNPEAEIVKLALLFTHLKAQGAEMSKFYQAMTLLNMKELDFDKIKVMFVTNWHRTTTLGQPTPKINKISGVQQKKKDPNWKKGKGKDNMKLLRPPAFSAQGSTPKRS
ncbi:hypothetical protein AMATHDRAFT_10784 [Amanita thiersii Skay4041]|uniref:Uncharacterized protein n=1 Tax=Amanita thiersii Skay4041 TaxID=703135 RepID=A0A2A9NAL5_9AGAR|nr:hypothetical protein AMATHDRAFT_10784 [Amanita thiersii Skay4041]